MASQAHWLFLVAFDSRTRLAVLSGESVDRILSVLPPTARATPSTAPDGPSHMGDAARGEVSLVSSETGPSSLSASRRVAAFVSEVMIEGAMSKTYVQGFESGKLQIAAGGIFQLFQDGRIHSTSYRRYARKQYYVASQTGDAEAEGSFRCRTSVNDAEMSEMPLLS